MLEEAIPSIWASVYCWFTPAVLFVLLNLVIGTIAVTSKGIRSPQHHRDGEEGGAHHPDDPRKLARSPSAVFDRLRSFSFHRYRSGEDPLETAPPPPAPRVETIETLHAPAHPGPAEAQEQQNLSRSQSDAHPTAGEMPPKLAGRMKKSASATSSFAHFEEADIVRPAAAAEEEEGADEVDARADDFINRFRQQLKLQRLESLLRYREMLNRGP